VERAVCAGARRCDAAPVALTLVEPAAVELSADTAWLGQDIRRLRTLTQQLESELAALDNSSR
jgi:hypothetical protein